MLRRLSKGWPDSKKCRFYRIGPICVGSQAIILRQMQLPKMAPRELRSCPLRGREGDHDSYDEAVIDYIELGEHTVEASRWIWLWWRCPRM